jgi:IS605 OrfB family transposase
LRKTNGNYFIDVFFKKDAPAIKTKGKTIGLDCGYKKLLIDSDGQIYDKNLEEIYNKISRKQQGSKTFKKSLIERDQKINESVKSIDLTDVKSLIGEDLKNVKHKSKGKIAKKFNNKLQRWSYAKVLNKLEMICESLGVLMIRVDPAYSSQTCHVCHHTDKASRDGEYFKCTACDASFDADHNAARNILFRGLSANMVPVLTIKTKLKTV